MFKRRFISQVFRRHRFEFRLWSSVTDFGVFLIWLPVRQIEAGMACLCETQTVPWLHYAVQPCSVMAFCPTPSESNGKYIIRYLWQSVVSRESGVLFIQNVQIYSVTWWLVREEGIAFRLVTCLVLERPERFVKATACFRSAVKCGSPATLFIRAVYTPDC